MNTDAVGVLPLVFAAVDGTVDGSNDVGSGDGSVLNGAEVMIAP